MDKRNNPQSNDSKKNDTPSDQHLVNEHLFNSGNAEDAENYGLTLGNHHNPLISAKTQNYIDHVSEPVNNTYI